MAYAIFLFLALLLLWWGPTEQTRRPLQMFVALVVFALGFEGLRRLAVRDNPGAAEMSAGAALTAPFENYRASRAASKRLEELDRLARLKESGAITDAEFQARKNELG